MIYCREKLIDILLEAPWVSLEERFDFDIALDNCLRRGLFTKGEWQQAEYFLCTGNDYNVNVERVILVLAEQIKCNDGKFLQNLPPLARSTYEAMDKTKRGVRL